jgi:hypothetical protein
MESKYPDSWHRHTPKGMSVINTVNKSKKCCDSCSCNEEQEDFNKLMETQTSFEE